MLVQLAEYYHARNMQNWPRVKRVNDYILGNKWWETRPLLKKYRAPLTPRSLPLGLHPGLVPIAHPCYSLFVDCKSTAKGRHASGSPQRLFFKCTEPKPDCSLYAGRGETVDWRGGGVVAGQQGIAFKWVVGRSNDVRPCTRWSGGFCSRFCPLRRLSWSVKPPQ